MMPTPGFPTGLPEVWFTKLLIVSVPSVVWPSLVVRNADAVQSLVHAGTRPNGFGVVSEGYIAHTLFWAKSVLKSESVNASFVDSLYIALRAPSPLIVTYVVELVAFDTV